MQIHIRPVLGVAAAARGAIDSRVGLARLVVVVALSLAIASSPRADPEPDDTGPIVFERYDPLRDYLAASAAADSAPEAGTQPAVDAATLRWRNTAVIAGGLSLVALYADAKWYQDGFGGGFKTHKEGWFSEGTKYGGQDKLGHVGFSYMGMRLFSTALRAVGNPPEAAADLSLVTVLATMTTIEVLDGYSRKYSFSREDAIANVVGAGLGWAFERYPRVDELIDLRLRYRQSTRPDGGRSDFDPFGDYEGQTYLIVGKASGVPGLRDVPVLRYAELAVGYGARGFDPRTSDPQRNFYFGVGINVGQLLADTVFRNSGPLVRGANRTVFEYVQVPFMQKLWKKRF